MQENWTHFFVVYPRRSAFFQQLCLVKAPQVLSVTAVKAVRKKCYAIRKNGKKFGSYNKMSYLCTLKHLINV
jgi:hypothetical protein